MPGQSGTVMTVGNTAGLVVGLIPLGLRPTRHPARRKALDQTRLGRTKVDA
jgi:hypothetical protein